MTRRSSADELHRRRRPFEVPDGSDCPDGPASQRWQWYELLRATERSAASWIDADCVLAVHAHAGFRALAGESGAPGGTGWVALTHDDREATLHRLAVSRSSDPFSHVTLSDTELTGVSTADRVWTFPRYTPQHVCGSRRTRSIHGHGNRAQRLTKENRGTSTDAPTQQRSRPWPGNSR